MSDPRFSQYIEKGDHGDIVIIGCPFDFFRKRTIHKGGQDNGPCCLRRFYPKVGPLTNPEFDIDVSKIKVSDYGNINVELTEEEERSQFKDVRTRKFKGDYVNYYKESPEKIIELMESKIDHFLANKQIPFLMGGSKECVLAAANSFFKSHSDPESTFILLGGKPFLKPPFDGDKGTSDNIMTVLHKKYPQNKFLVFGPQLQYFPSKYIDYGQDGRKIIKTQTFPKTKFVLLDQIREFQINLKRKLHQRTQGLHKFMSIFPQKGPVFVCISLEVVTLFLGCRDASFTGLEMEEMVEIMMFLGSQDNVVGVCISEFNPSCEDFESSLKILNMLYYFVMGRARTKQA